MKHLFRVTLSLAVVLALAVAVGCGKKENPTTPTTDSNTTTQQNYANQANGMNTLAIGFAGAFSGGLENYNPATTLGKLGFAGASQAKADTVWQHYDGAHINHFNPTPGNTGWWYFTVVDTPLVRYWVRFSPDTFWLGPLTNVTRVDWECNLASDSGTAQYSAFVSENPDTTLDGGWYFGISGGGSTAYWLYNFDNISLHGWEGVTRDCHGTIHFNLVANGDSLLTGNLEFANGTGTTDNCWIKLSGTTIIIKYSFLNNGTGNYYLLGENFATPHPFIW